MFITNLFWWDVGVPPFQEEEYLDLNENCEVLVFGCNLCKPNYIAKSTLKYKTANKNYTPSLTSSRKVREREQEALLKWCDHFGLVFALMHSIWQIFKCQITFENGIETSNAGGAIVP